MLVQDSDEFLVAWLANRCVLQYRCNLLQCRGAYLRQVELPGMCGVQARPRDWLETWSDN